MKELLYYLTPNKRFLGSIYDTLKKHPEIKFVSLIAVDLGNNHTDERIPIENFLKDIDAFFEKGIQTDGSSVVLPEIAEINDAKVDLVPDQDAIWYVDYNFNNIDEHTNKPIGTLLIPAFLKHNNTYIDSRSVLKSTVEYFNTKMFELIHKDENALDEIGIFKDMKIDSFIPTIGTELEFWVQTPDTIAEEELLSTSQTLKEQYWKRTVGQVRTGLENTLLLLNQYGFQVEMGHKEVGGVPSKLKGTGVYKHIMEQLEIDWRFDTALNAADKELFAKDIISDSFVRHGMEVTFKAKPIEGVAGSGEHMHVGISAKLEDEAIINLFSVKDDSQYMSKFGYGALMGVLKNYEVIHPFVTASNDALNRLKPGFEAPVCIVSSIGHTPETPSRNRTVLIGLVKANDEPLSTRFELRSPNPNTNTYLAISAVLLGMLDGIRATVTLDKTQEDLFNEINKSHEHDGFYLEKDRLYRSEEDVFECFSSNERDRYFGKPSRTVWEIMNHLSFEDNPEKMGTIALGGTFSERIIHSYKSAMITNWITELDQRIIPQNSELIKSFVQLHDDKERSDMNVELWNKISALRVELLQDTDDKLSLFSTIHEAIRDNNYAAISEHQIEMIKKILLLKELYHRYQKNIL